MEELLRHLVTIIKPWPWSTIAAFMAVGVTLWVANSQSRQKRRQLRQDAILEINFEANAWGNAAGLFLAHVAVYLEHPRESILPWAVSVSEPMAKANYAMDRALKSAHMTCDDFRVIKRVAETENQLHRFQKLLNAPHPQDAEGLMVELTTVKDEGRQIQVEFAKSTEALVRRGFAAYALPKGVVFQIRHRSAITWGWVTRRVSQWRRRNGER